MVTGEGTHSLSDVTVSALFDFDKFDELILGVTASSSDGHINTGCLL